jgi:hypothetical protein
MQRMRLSIDFARESAHRRRGGLPPISLAAFQQARDARPAWQCGWDHLHTYALAQYRIAVAEQCGGQPVRGSLRMAWAAACAPDLTVERILRVARPVHSEATAQ